MAETYLVLAGALRLRKEPGGGAVLTVLPRGQPVQGEQKETQHNITWLKVTTTIHERNFKGFVDEKFVMQADPFGQSHPAKDSNLKVTSDRLLALTPTAKDWIVTALAQNFTEATDLLDTPRRLCHFLAQAAHECDGFRTLEEYGGPAYWKKYEGRADLGNTQPNDGARYHGRGIFQLTGRSNYTDIGQTLKVPLDVNPDMAAESLLSLKIACEYWKARGLQRLADAHDITGLTKGVNGGLNGFEQRKQYYRRAWSIWGEAGKRAEV